MASERQGIFPVELKKPKSEEKELEMLIRDVRGIKLQDSSVVFGEAKNPLPSVKDRNDRFECFHLLKCDCYWKYLKFKIQNF